MTKPPEFSYTLDHIAKASLLVMKCRKRLDSLSSNLAHLSELEVGGDIGAAVRVSEYGSQLVELTDELELACDWFAPLSEEVDT